MKYKADSAQIELDTVNYRLGELKRALREYSLIKLIKLRFRIKRELKYVNIRIFELFTQK